MTYEAARTALLKWLVGTQNMVTKDEFTIEDHMQEDDKWLFLVVDNAEGSKTTVQVAASGKVDWLSQKV
jgi:hypothetical protein